MTTMWRMVFSRMFLTKLGVSMILAMTMAVAVSFAASIQIHNTFSEISPLQIVPVALRFEELLVLQPSRDRVLEQNISSCDLADAIARARDILDPLPVSVGSRMHQYTEYRVGSEIAFRDPEKTIALALMHTETCELRGTTITKAGSSLVARDGFHIEPVTRSNGIQWNNWATEFQVIEPTGYAVVLLKYPTVRVETTTRIVKKKKVTETKEVVTPLYYTPYSRELHAPELVEDGEKYLRVLATGAYQDLRNRGVPSRALPSSFVADVSALRPEYLMRLAPIEHMDLTEFLFDPSWTAERIHVVIGANLATTATYTCSKASACGLMQFTRGTYALMRQVYPTAGLLEDFEAGARDPRNAMKAALLLHDYNLAELAHSFGLGILRDAQLEEYLAAAYNTGVGRVIAVVAQARKDNYPDWTDAVGKEKKSKLLPETKGYIAKLRFLRDIWRS